MADEAVQGETPEQAAPVEPQAQEAQDEFDKERAMELIKKLRAENKDLSKAAKRAAELEAIEQKRKDAELSEAEKLQKQLAEAQSRLKEVERNEMRRAVADKVGLPPALAKRLQGETPEELEADAKEMLETLPKPKAPALSPTNPSGGQQGETLEQKRSRIWGGNANPFDEGVAVKAGGGVFFPDQK